MSKCRETADVAASAGQVGDINTWTAANTFEDIRGNTDTSGSKTGSVTPDLATYRNLVWSLTGNITVANPTTEQIGQSGFMTFRQDATGGRTISWGTDYENVPTISTTLSTDSTVSYVVLASGRILLGSPILEHV